MQEHSDTLNQVAGPICIRITWDKVTWKELEESFVPDGN